MKTKVLRVFWSVFVVFMLFSTTIAFAQGEEPPIAPTFDFNVILGLLIQFGQLAGVAVLLAALVQVGKYFNIVKDGTSGTWYAILSLFGMGVMVFLHFFSPTIGIDFLDAQAEAIAKGLLLVLGYLMQLKVGAGTAKTLVAMEIPVLGASHSEGTVKK